MPTPDKGERWGVLGGAFDPVHRGHTTLAHDIYLKKKLDRVLFVPSCIHPHKRNQIVAPFEDRVAMLQLAVSEFDFFAIDEIERENELSGYTLDTIRALRSRYPHVTFYFLVGADNVAQLGDWHRPEEIVREIQVIAGTRPPCDQEQVPDSMAQHIEFVETSCIDISSSQVRDMIRSGSDPDRLDVWIDQKVKDYILSRGLYR